MPAVGFIGTPVTAAEELQAMDLKSHASGYGKKVTREIRQLENFVEVNRAYFESRNHQPADIFALFAVQWRNSGRSDASFQAAMVDFRTFGVHPMNVKPSLDRVHAFNIGNAISRLATVADRVFTRKNLRDLSLPLEKPAR